MISASELAGDGEHRLQRKAKCVAHQGKQILGFSHWFQLPIPLNHQPNLICHPAHQPQVPSGGDSKERGNGLKLGPPGSSSHFQTEEGRPNGEEKFPRVTYEDSGNLEIPRPSEHIPLLICLSPNPHYGISQFLVLSKFLA